MRDLFNLMQSMDRRLTSIENDLRERVGQVETSLENAHQRIDELEGKVVSLENNLRETQLQSKQESVMDELRSKEFNLLFHGIPQSNNESPDQTEHIVRTFLTDKLQYPHSDLTKIEFSNVHRLPRRSSSTANTGPSDLLKSAPIAVKFIKMSDKRKIHSLAGRARSYNANITRHLPTSMQSQRKLLIHHANKFYKQGKTIRWKILQADYCLFVNGERFTDI
uniref:Mediator of RNA polymerase II transcription subunit 30-like n=1 Tax=Phallusia mammillata TaxID=59560 RepID=A0A6F9DKL4_9ASCI|nr:mediator of RNA polymerase II transcription subunit 30-like [Phallusia mammillata]